MKESFKEYYKPTEEEFEDLWGNCEFIFDANVLLNIYRYSPKTTGEFFDVLINIQDRIWMPHQAALEYQRNRFSVIEEQVAKCKHLENLLDKNSLDKNSLIKSLNDIKSHPFIDVEFIILELEKTFENLKDVLKTSRNNYPNTIQNDDLRDTITEIFDGKIGDEFSKKDLDNTYKKGKKRYADKIPPGFEDEDKGKGKGKPVNQKYGDCVLWHQIITRAKSEGKPVIFITDDAKKDWWLKRKNGMILGPHPLLIREMRLKSNANFYMYGTEMFLKHVKKYLGFDVDDHFLQEIENVQKDIRIEYMTENLKHLQNQLRHHQMDQEYLEAQRAGMQTEAQAEYAEAQIKAYEEAQTEYAEAQIRAYEEGQEEMYMEYVEAKIQAHEEAQAEMYAEAQAEMEQESQEDMESEDLE